MTPGRATPSADSNTIERLQPKYALLAIGLIVACFLAFAARPYSVVSDIGYQAFSARQYVDNYTTSFNSIRLVDPRDLARDIVTPLTAWTPAWTALYTIAFEAGLSAGKAGRVLALLVSICGALGWLRIISAIGLKGGWRIAGIVFASLYCLRTASVTMTGAGDQIVYAVAPWLLLAGLNVAVAWSDHLTGRLAFRTVLLCLALGAVYWLKYSGIFLSIAVFAAVSIEQFRARIRAHTVPSLLLLTLYGTAFVVPIVGLKGYNYARSGSDFLESSARTSRPRSATRLRAFVAETAYYAGPTLFSAAAGAERIAGTSQSARGWLIRVPGLILLLTFFYLMFRQPATYLRNVGILCGIIPLIGFPALSFLGGPHFSFAIGRCCEPYWILIELMVLAMLSRGTSLKANSGRLMAICVAFQILLFLWIPWNSAREALKIVRSPAYQTSPAELWDTDLSKYGTRDIDNTVWSLVRSPRDVIVPAIYSDRAFATDTMLEFGGRLLPLSPGFVPLVQTHGKNGANYNGSSPFTSSLPLRIVLVAPDPYERSDFREATERIMRRFTQVTGWTPGPADPHGRVSIWIGQVD